MNLLRRAVPLAILVALTTALLGMALPEEALAGSGVYPIDTDVPIRLAPGTRMPHQYATIDLAFRPDADETVMSFQITRGAYIEFGGWNMLANSRSSDGYVHSYGKPDGTFSTTVMNFTTTYYWYAKVRNSSGSTSVYGPYAVRLVPEGVSQQPPPAPVVPPIPPPPPKPPATSGKTYRAAPLLPSRSNFDSGGTSVRHSRLSAAVAATLKVATGKARPLSIACWSSHDWSSVASTGVGLRNDASTLLGFWKPSQPPWLHLSPSSCAHAQQLIDGRSLTGSRVEGLVTAIHEGLHAYGWSNEAQVNCYSVQLAPALAMKVGVPVASRIRVAKLAVNYTRAHAPRGYWNAAACRDGGKWDILPVKTLG